MWHCFVTQTIMLTSIKSLFQILAKAHCPPFFLLMYPKLALDSEQSCLRLPGTRTWL